MCLRVQRQVLADIVLYGCSVHVWQNGESRRDEVTMVMTMRSVTACRNAAASSDVSGVRRALYGVAFLVGFNGNVKREKSYV